MTQIDDVWRLLVLTYATGYNISEIATLSASRSIDDFSNVVELLEKKAKGTVSLGAIKKSVETAQKDADWALQFLKYQNIGTVVHSAPEYPAKLKSLKDFPPILYFKGQLPRQAQAAVIGTRDVSQEAFNATAQITNALIDQNLGIVSGLALGIDTMAHSIAVDRGAYTLAVMPNSLETVYPKINTGLANRILDAGGGLISELIFNINRGKKSFVERNRLQAAISDLVNPVEMSRESGTMHTIRFSMSLRRDIIVLKPSVKLSYLPQYEGINYLISEHKKSPQSNVHLVNDPQLLAEKIASIMTPPKATQTNLFGV